ncbi:MAG: S-layer homology domain-containing protein [Thermoanaerobacteraceae bacterium]|nr:S-layer homology domain-containing protein [Thermoanaerobacteraceae bacterium]
MKKWLRALLLGVAFTLVLVPAALAGTATVEELQQVFPEMPAGDSVLTRGVFAALLAEAAGIQVDEPTVDNQGEAWYLPAVRVLQEKGVIRGYPDGSLHTDRPVTLLEAAAMSSRVLGLPDGTVPPEVKVALEEESWGYTPYAWLTKVGLLGSGEDPAAYLTVDQGLAFLTRVFGTDPKAEEIVRAAQEAQTKIKDLRFTSSITMGFRPRPEAAGSVPTITMEGNTVSEFIYPLTLHQRMDVTVNLPVEAMPGGDLPEGGKMRMNIEQYLVDGNLYQKVEMPGAAEPLWMKIPGEVMPHLESLLEQSGNYAGLPPELQEAFHLHYLGEDVVEGRKVHRIAYYGRLDDWQALMKAFPTGLAPELQQALKEAGEVIKSLSFWGEEAIGVEDNLSYGAEMTGLVVLADELQGQALPLESLTFTMRSRDYRYDTGLTIQLPPEALAAEELPSVFPEPEAGAPGEDTAQQ